jgi:IS30 family transposase
MKYKQLTLEKRYHISALIKAGLNQKEIALEIGVTKLHIKGISKVFFSEMNRKLAS